MKKRAVSSGGAASASSPSTPGFPICDASEFTSTQLSRPDACAHHGTGGRKQRTDNLWLAAAGHQLRRMQ